MAYDDELAHRIREIVQDEPGLSERRMFGGLAFLVNGHLAVCAGNEGGLLLRIHAAQAESLIDDDHVRRFRMRDRELSGWLHVDVEVLRTGEELRRFVGYGLSCARSFDPK
jgi:hypothetical protein